KKPVSIRSNSRCSLRRAHALTSPLPLWYRTGRYQDARERRKHGSDLSHKGRGNVRESPITKLRERTNALVRRARPRRRQRRSMRSTRRARARSERTCPRKRTESNARRKQPPHAQSPLHARRADTAARRHVRRGGVL